MNVSDLTLVLISVIALPPSIFYANWLMRKEHPGEIYIIWYIFSFSFLLFLGLEIAAEANNYRLTQMCGSYEGTCKAIYGSLKSAEDEFYLLGIVTGLVLGPQLLTYILSGIFGAASTPKFVWVIKQFIIWSYIKFNACLSGIQAASAFSKLITHRTAEWDGFGLSLLWLTMAFSYAAIACAERAPSTAVEKWAFRQLFRLHKFFTRHAREE